MVKGFVQSQSWFQDLTPSHHAVRPGQTAMLLYTLRRLIYLVPVAFGVSLLVFALVHLAPGRRDLGDRAARRAAGSRGQDQGVLRLR